MCLLLLILYSLGGTVVLTSNITAASNAILCPGGVKFTCIARLERQSTLLWFKTIYGQEKQPLANYTHDQLPPNTALPLMILASPKVVVVNSMQNALNATFFETTFNSTFEANLSWFVDMNVSSIECGSYEDFGTHHSSYLIRSKQCFSTRE